MPTVETMSNEEFYRSIKEEKRKMLSDAIASNTSLTETQEKRLKQINMWLEESQENRQMKGNENKMNKNKEFLKQLKEEKEINMSEIEVRATGTQYAPSENNSQVEVPQNLVAGILMEAQRSNELFHRVHMIQTSQDTKLNVGAYQQEELAQLDEFEQINMKDFTTNHVEVVMSRFGTGTRVSKRLIQASNFDVLHHCQLLMGDRLGLTCEKLVIRALEANAKVQKVGYITGDVYETPLNAIVKALLKLKPVDRAQSVIVCSPNFFEKAVLQQDSNGRNMLSWELSGIRPTVMGVQVVVSDALETGAYVGNFNRAVVACVNLESVKAVDEPSVHAIDVFLNSYVGCAVQMPEAVVRVEYTGE